MIKLQFSRDSLQKKKQQKFTISNNAFRIKIYQNNQKDEIWDEDEQVPGSDGRSGMNRRPQDVLAVALIVVKKVVVVKFRVGIQLRQMLEHRDVRLQVACPGNGDVCVQYRLENIFADFIR